VLRGSLNRGRLLAYPYWLKANIHEASDLFCHALSMVGTCVAVSLHVITSNGAHIGMEKPRKKSPALLQVSPVPLYTQIKEILRDRILDGTYQAHQQMPSKAN
jgi:hypothetical protein